MSETSPNGTWRTWHDDSQPIRIGVSSCLLGNEVRFDGGHARDRFVQDVLGTWVEFVPVCPEVEVGMPVPRPTIRIADEGDGERLIDPRSGADHTDAMQAYTQARVGALRDSSLDGFVLKKSSPSCGLERISVYRGGGRLHRKGMGLFARGLTESWPELPVEEEGRLNDAKLRENFIERIFSRHRWRTLVQSGLTRGRLVEFHTAHKMLLRAHNEAGYQRLGRLLGGADGKLGDAELFQRYEADFQATLRFKASVKRHVNVLQHAMGYLKALLGAGEKRELLASIDDYHKGLIPLIVPLSLLRFNIRKHDIEYLAGQLYFDPHPKELMLRNHC